MTDYKTPGVYVEEISTLGSSVASVPTAIPGFVGYTKQAPVINGVAWTYPSSAPAPAVRITSMLEFNQVFGGAKNTIFNVALAGTIEETTIAVTPTFNDYKLYYNMQLFYANGGGVCYVVSTGSYSSGVDDTALVAGIANLAQIDEVTLLVVPETTASSMDQSERLAVNTAMLTQCKDLKDRFAIIDAVQAASTVATDATTFRGDVGANDLKYGAAYYPALITTLSYTYDETIGSDGVTIATDTRAGSPFATKKLYHVLNGDTGLAADKKLYNAIKAELDKFKVNVGASAAMAGVYARVDATRGVWKAPANVGLALVTSPSRLITDSEQQGLNIDAASGKSMNVIRLFSGKGTIVWGARTLAGNDNEWRYINVRRLFNYVEESIQKATEFVVFEPNTASTWQRVKGMSEAFLTNLWRDGALAGATPKDAFFVRVGLGTTMTADDILNGKMIVEIGIAAVRPAEFIILRFSHKLQES